MPPTVLVWTARNRASITRPLSFPRRPAGIGAQVAQLVEHVTENHGVPSSILGGRTIYGRWGGCPARLLVRRRPQRVPELV